MVAMTRIHSYEPCVEKPEYDDAGLPAEMPFVFSGAEGTCVGLGIGPALPPTAVDHLGEAVSTFWANQKPDRPTASLLVGALPFDRKAPAHLYAPQKVVDTWPVRRKTAGNASRQGWTHVAEPAPAAYAKAVTRALTMLSGPSDLRKVVLARSLLVTAPTTIDPHAVLARLSRDPSVTTYAVPLPASDGRPSRVLVGASPELLVDKRGTVVRSGPLAGSARRHSDPAADTAAATGLVNSLKDQREHAFVVEAILDTLTPYCRDLKAPATPSLVSTASMWHLGTRIEGALKDADASVVELAAALHPTPAVCGLPREPAREAIATLENVDRGYYAGAVGWADRRGDGHWIVAIRCAELSGHTARLYAGAGIVPGSDPWSEVAETSAKFAALLSALGIDEDGDQPDAGQKAGTEE